MSNTDLALRTSTDVPALFREQMDMAKSIASSSLLPRHLQGKPENLLVILAGARSLDISWFWACQSLYVVEGKLSFSAELMRGLVSRAGHKFRIIEQTAEKAVVEIVRADDPDYPARFEFNKDDARVAGLLDRATWKKFPKAMMLARATSMAVRSYCSDVLFGTVYTPEELGAAVDESGEAIFDKDGRVIIDTTTAEGDVDQDTVDKAAADILGTPDLTMATASYAIILRNRWTHLIPNLKDVEANSRTLYDLWIGRLEDHIKDAVDRETGKTREEREDDLRKVWYAASNCKLIDQATPSLGTSFKDAIMAAKKSVDALTLVDNDDDEPAIPAQRESPEGSKRMTSEEVIDRLGGGEKIGESS